jgi:hypothetical protein
MYGPPAIGQTVHAAAEAAAHAFPSAAGALEWIVGAVISGALGMLVGVATIPIVAYAFAPVWKLLKRALFLRF